MNPRIPDVLCNVRAHLQGEDKEMGHRESRATDSSDDGCYQ